MKKRVAIENVLFAAGNGASFYEDQAAIRAGSRVDGFRYVDAPQTPGFTAIQVPAASVSIGLVLEGGEITWGDMMSVQYSAAAGRDPLFETNSIVEQTKAIVVPRLRECDPSDFIGACRSVLALTDGVRLPVAVEYGVSQALLQAAATARGLTMAEVICEDFNLPLPVRTVPLYAQSGDAREVNVDKMIMKSVDVIPHGLINSREVFGKNGEEFRRFVKWVADRVNKFGARDYHPILHFDVYGWMGHELGLDPVVIADFIAKVTSDVPDFIVDIECPADFGSRNAQIDGYLAIIDRLNQLGSTARIVVDERCNTLDDIQAFAEAKAAHLIQIKSPDVGSIVDIVNAVITCKKNGVGAYLGGSATETDLSARTSVHVSVATQAEMMLAKPGLGVDEAISITGNEQNRLFAILKSRAPKRALAGV